MEIITYTPDLNIESVLKRPSFDPTELQEQVQSILQKVQKEGIILAIQ